MTVSDIPESTIPDPTIPDPAITVIDHGTPLTLTFDDCVKYHGRTSIGGAALGFRLMQRAFADLSPDGPPDREAISVRTAFPGPGLRDAIELITRAVTRDAYFVDHTMGPPSAPEAVIGRFWFEVTINGGTRAYVTPEGAVGPEFISIGRTSKQRPLTAAEDAHWTELKEALAKTLMSLSPDHVILDA